MASRPTMQTKNSHGKQVSLLNDDSAPVYEEPSFIRNFQYPDPTNMARSYSNNSGISSISSPKTPGLLRADSYDSQTTNDPVSPVTPVFMNEYGRVSSYAGAGFSKGTAAQYDERSYEYPAPHPSQPYPMQGGTFQDTRSSYAEEPQFDEDAYEQDARGAKRYPCRFRDNHHCEKTFTTSGHASRHSKIHTAEKAVHCTYQGCQKKFTRSDNMKQHLETHFKLKCGSSGQKMSSKTSLTAPSGIRKSVPPARSSRPPSRNLGEPMDFTPFDPALFVSESFSQSHAAHLVGPVAPYGSMDLSNAHGALMSQPVAARMNSSSGGLDALANMAAMHNE